jgi:hypothetical protein
LEVVKFKDWELATWSFNLSSTFTVEHMLLALSFSGSLPFLEIQIISEEKKGEKKKIRLPEIDTHHWYIL